MLGWVWPRLFGKRRAEDITREFGEDAQLVFSRKTESILFHRFRMWTQRVGASRNVGHRGRKLPALMMPEQAAYAFGFERDPKRRRLLDGPGLTRKETDRDVVYRDLADRGYVVGSACRYGGDFVIYDSHPSRCHSKATIRVVKPDETVSCTDLAGYCRVQGSVLKRAVFASVDPDTNKPQYVSFAFNPALSTEANKKLERRLSRVITHSNDPRPVGDARRDDEPEEDDFIPGHQDEFELAAQQHPCCEGEDDDDDEGEETPDNGEEEEEEEEEAAPGECDDDDDDDDNDVVGAAALS